MAKDWEKPKMSIGTLGTVGGSHALRLRMRVLAAY